MTCIAPTFTQIKAHVQAVRKKVPNARVFGIASSGRWTGDRLIRDGTESYYIAQCDSPLALRIALQHLVPDVTAKVLVTGLSDQQVEDDILVRLAKRSLIPLKSWEIVKSLFQAQRIDPRFSHHAWIADQLLELVPSEGYSPAPAGFLDAETIWAILLERRIGLASAEPDLVSLLKWSMDATNIKRLREAPETFFQAAVEWTTQKAGPAAFAILRYIQSNELPDAVPIGISLGVLLSDQASGRLDRALGRMEQFAGGSLDPHIATRWHSAAVETVTLHVPDIRTRRAWLDRADELLRAVEADGFAYLSGVTPLGFQQRLARFGQALQAVLVSEAKHVPDQLVQARRAAWEHDQAKYEGQRLQRVDMAMRLVRWLAARRPSHISQPVSFAEAASLQIREGGFIDWARQWICGGEPVRELSEAYARLWAAVTEIKEQQNKHFGELLRDWTATGRPGDDIVPVESVLDRIVAPLAAQAPVLVLVIDGMSVAVFRELLEDICRHDWSVIREKTQLDPLPVLATIPSVTEVSRTSLFCGELRQGTSDDEKAGFASHPALLTHCRNGLPPVLFHKVALHEAADASLAANVREEIASSRRRVVGVVINAVDDHLLKGEQLDIRWGRDEIKALPALLYEARAAHRLVVLLSDHGHVFDHHSEFRKAEDAGERWRPDDGQPKMDEVQLAGPRVVIPPPHRLIAPWSERVRYGVKKNGYHGGASAQEMVIPLAVLSAGDDPPSGWVEPPIDLPTWWEEPASVPAPGPAQIASPAIKSPKRPKGAMLFDLDEDEPPVKSEPKPEAKSGPSVPWLAEFLKSPTLRDQKKRCGRTIPSDDAIGKLVTALDEQGGKLTATALARRMELPLFRLRGLLAVAQRMLNVEGYAILTKDEASDTVEFNRDLLLRQFELI
jgi:hypothetical protein